MLAHLNGRTITRKRVRSVPWQHADIKTSGIAGQLRIGDRRQKMRVWQSLNLDSTRLVSDEDPLPGRSFARCPLDQFLVDQPRFNRTKISQTRTRYARDFICDLQFSTSDLRPVFKINRLLQQKRALPAALRFREKFLPGIKYYVGITDGPLMKPPDGRRVCCMVHHVRIILVRHLIDNQALVKLPNQFCRRRNCDPENWPRYTFLPRQPANLQDQQLTICGACSATTEKRDYRR